MLRSQLKNLKAALPEHPGVSGGEDYINSAVLILLSEISGEMNFILQKRSANVRQGGEIGFPGGAFDPSVDKNTADTAVRETCEEMGLAADEISLIGQCDSVMSISGMLVEGFIGLAEIKDPRILDINPHEVERAFSVPVSFFEKNDPGIYRVNVMAHPSITDRMGHERVIFPAKELGLPERYHKPWGTAALQKVYVYRYDGEIIWGMTARFIFDMVKKIKELK